MWYVLLLFLLSIFTSICGFYPDVRIDHRVPGWKARGRVSYLLCSSRDFELEYGQTFRESRGLCLLTMITAVMYNGKESIRTDPDYTSSGTAYSQYEIVAGGSKFCIQRVGTICSYRLQDE